MKGFLYEHGLYILGDSAYTLESFLLCPYLQPHPKSSEDAFNFHHSSARITAECAFGEIDLRWGILWKRLMCSLEHSALIIEGAMCLHNYLVDYRESNKEKNEWDVDRTLFNEEILDTNADVLQVGNDNIRVNNRPFGNRTERQKGQYLRHCLCQSLADHDMQRPSRSEWNENKNTHVVMLYYILKFRLN